MPHDPVRIVTSGPSNPVRIVTSGISRLVHVVTSFPSEPVRIVTSGVSEPVRLNGGLAPDAPTFVSGEVGTVGTTTVVVVFSTDITAPCGNYALGFTVLINGAPNAITGAILVGGNTIQFTLTTAVAWGDTVTISYDSTVGCIMESTGVTDLATFAAQAVTNNVAMPWYRAGGAPAPIAAYQPKGAASYAASKINLANPGTYDAADGVAFPTWVAVTGWTFNGSSQYLNTGITPASGWSALVQFSGGGALTHCVLGQYTSGTTRFQIYNSHSGIGNVVLYGQGGYTSPTPKLAAGNLGFTGQQGYRNGASDGLAIGAWSGVAANVVYIGCNDAGGVAQEYFGGNVLAVVIYSSDITASIAAVAAAMAAL